MNKEIIKFSILFIVLLLVQVMICNHIAIFNVAVPLIFIYFIIRLPIDIGKGVLFTLAFIMGLCVDVFSDTPGLNSLACTMLAAFKDPIYYAYIPKRNILHRQFLLWGSQYIASIWYPWLESTVL